MKIKSYLGKTLKETEKEFNKLKPSYCEGCGRLCKQTIKKMNTLYDTDTGKQVITYCIETRCPVGFPLRGFKFHTGDDPSWD